jgi:hypothetical protein
MDGLDLVTIASIAQTVVLTITLIVFILQLRSQTQAIKDAAYQSVLNDYNDIMRAQLSRPEISELLDDVIRSGRGAEFPMPQLSHDEKILRSYIMMIYSLFERVYILREKEWIDEASWREWATWIEVMARNPIFAHVHTLTGGMFNAAFQEYVSGVLEGKKSAGTGGSSGRKR